MKHTQGPWILGTYDHASYNITGPQGQMPFIATIPADRDNREANARLIAAAPDLLAALEIMLIDAEATPERERDPTTIYRMDMARAAIAKAK